MARVLKSGPNVEIDEIWDSNFHSKNYDFLKKKDIPVALNALVGLNEVSKQEWLNLINEMGFEIEIRPRDANRDIVGKLINYLAKNPTAREKLTGRSEKKKSGPSSELTNALNLLLK